MSWQRDRELINQQDERKDREAVYHIEDFQGPAELLAYGCGVPWTGIVADVHSASPLWISFGAGASAIGRSPALWSAGREARDMLTFVRGQAREMFPLTGVVEGVQVGMLVIQPVRSSEGELVAFVWLADQRARELSAAQRRCLELVGEEIRLRLEMRQRIVEKLDMVTDLRRVQGELRSANRELVLARDRALEGERAKVAFLTNLGHELRTPLNAILGFTEMLLEEAREREEHAGFVVPLEHVLDSAQRLTEMIENTLALVRLETRRMPLCLESFDVGRLLTGAVELAQPFAARSNNELTLTLTPGLGTMHSDPTKIRQIVYNLLGNACKFTENGKVSVSAARVQQADGEFVRIVVADTGIGMTHEQIEKIFDEFATGGARSSAPKEGLGVGLAVANRFCRLLGGSIRVTSRPGHGSRFVVMLPVKVEVGDRTPFSSSGALAAVTPEMSAVPASAPLVLVIESDAEASDLVADTARRCGFRALQVATLAAAMSVIEQETPAAIMLNVNLADEDGWALLTRLRTIPALVDVPLLLATDTLDRNLAFQLGATDVMFKPLSAHTVAETLRRWLRDDPAGPGKISPEDGQ
jgi:signal transduction histidine kinase/ActR/RegA family two-component response regulator